MASLEVYTVREVADLLRCNRYKINCLIEAGELDAADIGTKRHQYRISRVNLEKFLGRTAEIEPNTKRPRTSSVKQFV